MKRARLTDWELRYLENTVANAVGIIQRVKALAYQVDDPDTLELALEIMRRAQSIRTCTIAQMAALKEAVRSRKEAQK